MRSNVHKVWLVRLAKKKLQQPIDSCEQLRADLHVVGGDSETCFPTADGFLGERPCLVLLPIGHAEIRKTMIDSRESSQAADVERVSFRKLDFLRCE